MADPVRIAAELTNAEAVAFASVIRRLRPPDEIASAWYGAIDKISKQLPESYPRG